MTGIQVELIDLNALEETYAEHEIEPDPFLAACFPRFKPGQGWSKERSAQGVIKARLLINIDYAFVSSVNTKWNEFGLVLSPSMDSFEL